MKWTRGESRQDIEDRRGQQRSGGGGGLGGLGGMVGGGGLPIGKMGIGGIVILLLVAVLGGGNLLTGGGGGSPSPVRPSPSTSPSQGKAGDDEMMDFMAFVMNDNQRTWEKKLGNRYRHAKLVVYTDATETRCGVGESAMGPFYCPPDEKVYIDFSFYQELATRFGAPGQFAQAYVVAHEVGHHVQKLLGTEARMRELQERYPNDANELSVRLELQADCYAGIWGHETGQRQIIDKADLQDGLNAAAAVGDDRLQKQSGGRVAPEKWTHGSSEMRMRWFRRGLANGEVNECDTFSAREL